MESKTQICLIVGIIVVVAIFLYIFFWRNKKQPEKTESYVAAGALDNVGSFIDDQYELIQSPDADVPAPHFADMVGDVGDRLEYIEQPESTGDGLRPTERLDRIQGQRLLPRTSLSVTPYALDVADPQSHMYMVNTPRVQMKSKYMDNSFANILRGDVPITYHPNVCHITKTRQDRDDLRLSGYFTPHYNSLYNKYTGKSFKSMPIHIAGAGSAAGYGGASSGIIMDNYA
jgi:hypothetical protein